MKDHPRLRRTNSSEITQVSTFVGSPPLTQDKFKVNILLGIVQRITPAYAGQIKLF